LSLLDVKRGDIGSTMTAYADAYCDPSSPLAADAVTASAFLGFGSLEPLLDTARRHGRGVFVLALTSNPDGASVQHARTRAGSVAGDIVRSATQRNAAELQLAPAQEGSVSAQLGSVGLVIGATVGEAARALGLDLAGVRGPLLCPGIGAQGAAPSWLPGLFGPAMPNVVPAASREILRAGPDVADIRRVAEQLNRLCVAVATT
jgi:orotidine-5'-phosphate decarboxylase